jgi:hypothetical protein
MLPPELLVIKSVISVAPIERTNCMVSKTRLVPKMIKNLFCSLILGASIDKKIPKGMKIKTLSRTSLM